MRSRPNGRVLISLATLLIAVPIIVVLTWLVQKTTPAVVAIVDPTNPKSELSKGELDAAMQPVPSIASKAGDFENLHHVCSGTYPEWIGDCFLALDEYFIQKPYGFFEIIEPREPRLWEDVLGDPDSARLNVHKVYSDPQCDIGVDSIRSDLYTICHAESLVSYALFRYECATTDEAIGPLQTEADDFSFRRSLPDHLSRLNHQTNLTLSEYINRRTKLEEEYYFSGWLLKKCDDLLGDHALPVVTSDLKLPELLLDDSYLSGVVDAQKIENIYLTGARAGLFRGDNPKGFMYIQKKLWYLEARELISRAARLGNEWAQTIYRGIESYMNALRVENPLVWLLVKARSFEPEARLATPHKEIAAELARTQNRIVNWDFLRRLSIWEYVLRSDLKIQYVPEGAMEYYRLYGN